MDQTVNRNDTATFTVEATAGGDLTYEWRRDDVNLNDTDNEIMGATTNTLKVLNTQNDDEGDYTCIVTNSGGNFETSDAATLTVGKLTGSENQQVCRCWWVCIHQVVHVQVLLL